MQRGKVRHMIQRPFLKCAEDLWKANQGHLGVYAKGEGDFCKEKQKERKF